MTSRSGGLAYLHERSRQDVERFDKSILARFLLLLRVPTGLRVRVLRITHGADQPAMSTGLARHGDDESEEQQ